MRGDIEARLGQSESVFVDASRVASKLMGDSIATNLFLMGLALQRGWIPLRPESIGRAIELNGVAVDMNKRALEWGRLFAVEPESVWGLVDPVSESADPESQDDSLDATIRSRSEILTAYQDSKYARRYEELVARVRLVEHDRTDGRSELAEAVARSYFKLLAYKDEYEVARLYSDGQLQRELEAQFDGKLRISLELAPPLFAKRDSRTGRLEKWSFGPWIFPALGLLARFKVLRGTALDIFGYTAHRRLERRLILEFEETVDELIDRLSPDNHSLAIEIASLPSQILGFDQVKETAVAEVEEHKSKLLERLRGSPR